MEKIIVYCFSAFAISGLSSRLRRVLTHRSVEPVSAKMLDLNAEQSKQFAVLETGLGAALKDLTLEDAQNKIAICAFLHDGAVSETVLDASVRKMGETYRARQAKIARSLKDISAILTPKQREIFAQRLMHEVCMSCRTKTSGQKCICGMCGSGS